ncbi:hypothetical protein BH10BDE1_BH10BDE1_05530 [soil metagenome]
MTDASLWSLQQNSQLQAELDRVTDLAIEKITAKKITPELDRLGPHPDRARLLLSRSDGVDQAPIEAIFNKLPTRFPGMELLYDRTPDFFSVLRARGNASAVITARQGSSRDLWGLGSVSVREGYFNGAEARVAYLGDLRMLLSRSTARVWRQLYNQLLQDIANELGVASFLTAIVGDNTGALRSLVSRRNNEFTYEPLGRLRLLGILGRFSLLANGRRKLDEKRILLGADAEPEFARFYSSRACGMRHGWKEVPKAGLPIVLKNRHGETKIVARLVSPDAMKRMRIQSVEWKTRLLFQSLRATGVHPVAAGSSITTTYLSWVCFGAEMTPVEKRHALIEMIDACLEDPRIKELGLMNWMLIVPDTIGLSMRELGGRFHYSTPVELFEVRPESASTPQDLRSQILQDVGFEMSLI